MNTIIRNILGKDFEIKIADSKIIEGVDFHYRTQDDKIFGASFMWGTPLDGLEKHELAAIVGIIEGDLMNRRDITFEKKYVIVEAS